MEFKGVGMKEIVNIRVRVEIEYNENDPESRKEVIEKTKDNVTGIRTYGYPLSVKPLTVKIIK
jgi:hypothetical protein